MTIKSRCIYHRGRDTEMLLDYFLSMMPMQKPGTTIDVLYHSLASEESQADVAQVLPKQDALHYLWRRTTDVKKLLRLLSSRARIGKPEMTIYTLH